MSNEFVSWNELQKRGQDLQDPELVDNGLGSLLMKGAGNVKKSFQTAGGFKGIAKGVTDAAKKTGQTIGGAVHQGATNVQKGVKGFVSKAGAGVKSGFTGKAFRQSGKFAKPGAVGQAGQTVGRAGAALKSRGDAVVKSARAKAGQAGQWIKKNPKKSIAIGAGAGVAGGSASAFRKRKQ